MNATQLDNIDPQWSTALPTKAGTFQWRKNCQWEPKSREVYFSPTRGCLVTYSERYEQAVPLIQVYGEWSVADLAK